MVIYKTIRVSRVLTLGSRTLKKRKEKIISIYSLQGKLTTPSSKTGQEALPEFIRNDIRISDHHPRKCKKTFLKNHLETLSMEFP